MKELLRIILQLLQTLFKNFSSKPSVPSLPKLEEEAPLRPEEKEEEEVKPTPEVQEEETDMAWKFRIVQNEPVPYIIDEKGIIIGNLRDGNPRLSPHFKANEFACPCCKEYRISIDVLEGLERARELAGTPLAVARTTLESSVNPGGSGYRCPRHNARVAGASPTSNHMQGVAVDVSVPSRSITPKQLAAIMEQIPVFRDGGIGIYPTFVHVDSGRRRRW